MGKSSKYASGNLHSIPETTCIVNNKDNSPLFTYSTSAKDAHNVFWHIRLHCPRCSCLQSPHNTTHWRFLIIDIGCCGSDIRGRRRSVGHDSTVEDFLNSAHAASLPPYSAYITYMVPIVRSSLANGSPSHLLPFTRGLFGIRRSKN